MNLDKIVESVKNRIESGNLPEQGETIYYKDFTTEEDKDNITEIKNKWGGNFLKILEDGTIIDFFKDVDCHKNDKSNLDGYFSVKLSYWCTNSYDLTKENLHFVVTNSIPYYYEDPNEPFWCRSMFLLQVKTYHFDSIEYAVNDISRDEKRILEEKTKFLEGIKSFYGNEKESLFRDKEILIKQLKKLEHKIEDVGDKENEILSMISKNETEIEEYELEELER